MRILQSDNPRPLNLLALSSNGLVAAAWWHLGRQNDVEVWDIATGKLRFKHPPHHREPRSLAFTPDGKYLFVAEWQKIVAVDVATRAATTAPAVEFDFPEFALSADGTRLLASTQRDQYGILECWSLGPGLTNQRLWAYGPFGDYFRFPALALSADGKRAAVFERGNAGGAGGRPAHAITIRDAQTGGKQVTIPTDIASPAQQLAFSVDGATLLARPEGRALLLFSAHSGMAAGELVPPGRPYLTAMAVHPRGPVACVRTSGTVVFWDVAKREQLRTLDWKAGRLESIAFSPDGSLAAAGTETGQIVVWDVDL